MSKFSGLFFLCYCDHRDLNVLTRTFPTRRSSDLAALAAGLGVAPHARSLVPPGLTELPFNQLPPLGDVEFVVLAGRQGRRQPASALADMIKKHGRLLPQKTAEAQPRRNATKG